MAFPANATGVTVNWNDHIQSIIDVLQGTTADRIQIIQYNNASYYAGDFRNLETGSSLGLRVRDASNNVIATFAKNAIVLGASAASDALAINANISGKVYIGDSANAGMTVGLTINQGTNDDQIVAFKSSDVAHGMTDVVETDTYADMIKASATDGGMQLRGFCDANTLAILLTAFAVADDTTKTTAGVAPITLRAYKKSGTSHADVGADGNLLAVGNRTTTRLILDAEGHIHSIGASSTDMLGNGKWFLNDTANANVTLGLTINQGANTDHILDFKKSGVTHGMTTWAETDTYGFLSPYVAGGGLHLSGIMGTGTGGHAIRLQGLTVDAANTTKTTAGVGIISLSGAIKNGTGISVPGANANIVTIDDSGSTRFIFDVEGSAHADVEWVAYDDYDDLALIASLEAHMGADPVKAAFGDWVKYNKDALQAAKIVNFYDEGPRAMLNTTRLSMLLCGAVRQLGQRLALAEKRLEALPEGGATA